MPDIPSFFNKVDFFGVLLPGYLGVTLFLLIFRPELLFVETQALSFDLFSAVVFLIAGPAVGLALQQAHRHFTAIDLWYDEWKRQRKTKRGDGAEAMPPPGSPTSDYVAQYYHVRLVCSDKEKAELDFAEASYDFSASTCLALLLLAIYGLVARTTIPSLIPLLLASLSAFFLAGAILERDYTFWPLKEELFAKYPMPPRPPYRDSWRRR